MHTTGAHFFPENGAPTATQMVQSWTTREEGGERTPTSPTVALCRKLLRHIPRRLVSVRSKGVRRPHAREVRNEQINNEHFCLSLIIFRTSNTRLKTAKRLPQVQGDTREERGGGPRRNSRIERKNARRGAPAEMREHPGRRQRLTTRRSTRPQPAIQRLPEISPRVDPVGKAPPTFA